MRAEDAIIDDEEDITITLPANALETLGIPLGGQLSSGHGALEASGPASAASAARSEVFPCFKKSAWGDRLTVKIVQRHGAPGVA